LSQGSENPENDRQIFLGTLTKQDEKVSKDMMD
jgi:hypothetical protein